MTLLIFVVAVGLCFVSYVMGYRHGETAVHKHYDGYYMLSPREGEKEAS